MLLTIVSYNGTALNDINYQAWFDPDGPIMYDAEMVTVKRAENFPKLAKKKINGKVLPFWVKCLGTANTQLQTLKGLFDPFDQTPRKFLVADAADSNKQYYVMGTVQNLPELQGEAVLLVNLFLDYPVWVSNTEFNAQWTYTATGQTSNNVTPAGNVKTKPRITIQPQTAKSSSNNYTQRRFVAIYNRSTTTAFPDYPVDLTNGGLDTSALQVAGKMQTDMDDWRAQVEGVEVDRWLSAASVGASVKMWINLNLDKGIRLTLGQTIANTGAVTDVKFQSGSANTTNFKRLPAAGKVVIGSEIYTYTGKNDKTLTLTGCTRAAKGTSMASHAVGDVCWWIQYEIWMLYGNSTITAPVVDDTKKPMLDLANSTNTSWVYADFADDAMLRTAGWKPTVLSTSGKESLFYTGSHTALADPNTEMGMSVLAYQKNGKWQAETASIMWSLYHPAGVTQVSMAGDKRRSSTDWATLAGLQKSQNGTSFTTQWSEATPADNNWASWSRLNIALGATYKHLRAGLTASIKATASNRVDFEVQSCTLVLDNTATPVFTLGSEITNYYLDLTLTNTLTGESISLSWPMSTNDTLTIDCENKEVTFSDGTPALAPLDTSSIRQGWLDLTPGVNNPIRYDDSGTGNALVTVYWRDKMN